MCHTACIYFPWCHQEQDGQPHCSSSPNPWASTGSQTSCKHKPRKEKFAFKQTSELVELKSWLWNREYQVRGSRKENFCWAIFVDVSYSHPDSSEVALIFPASVTVKFHACHIIFPVISLRMVSVWVDNTAVLTQVHLINTEFTFCIHSVGIPAHVLHWLLLSSWFPL